MSDYDMIGQALGILRFHRDESECDLEECYCMQLDLVEIAEKVKDGYTKATSELRRLKKAVNAANLDIAYLADGQITLIAKGTVTA